MIIELIIMDIANFGLDASELEKITSVISSVDGVERAVLFGSRAKGNYKPYSDIDISLIGNGLTANDVMRLSSCIDDLLLPYEIDLNVFHSIKNERLKDHIHRCGVVIYDRGRDLG